MSRAIFINEKAAKKFLSKAPRLVLDYRIKPFFERNGLLGYTCSVQWEGTDSLVEVEEEEVQ